MHNPTDPTPPHPTSHVMQQINNTQTSRQLSFIFSGEYERTPTTSRKSTADRPISGPRGRPKTLSGLTFGIRTKFRDLSVQRNHTTTTLQVPEDPQEITHTHLTGTRTAVATKTPCPCTLPLSSILYFHKISLLYIDHCRVEILCRNLSFI